MSLSDRPVTGRWFEDFVVGEVVDHSLTRTATETDNIIFSSLSMNPARLHVDYASASQSEFGQPLVNSMFTVALLVGMTVPELTHGTTIANLGFGEIQFPTPVFVGDTIWAETEIISARPSGSRPKAGIVTFEHRGFNQSDALVCRAVRTALMSRTPQRWTER